MQNPNPSGQLLAQRYQVIALIGHGGMASVYQAYDTHLRQPVAIKIIHPHLADQPNFLQRFEAEAVVVARLRHPNIVQVYDFCHAGEQYFMVMEFLEGETLETRLKRLASEGRRLPIEQALRIASDLCDALHYAHQRGLVHRDIKPANIMLDPQERPILMDFGVARLLGGQFHTATGAVVGTALYMAPEQIQGQPVDARADIYALGGTLFQMLSNHPPFEADSAITLMMKHLHEPPPDVRQFQPSAPPLVTAILMKALAKLPEERYQSAQALAQALQQALAPAGSQPTATRPSPATTPPGLAGRDASRQPAPSRPAPVPLGRESAPRSAQAVSTAPGSAPRAPAAASQAPPPAAVQQESPAALHRQAALQALSAAERPPEPRRRPAWLLPLAITGLLAAVALAYLLLRPPPAQPAVLPASATSLLPATSAPSIQPPATSAAAVASATALPPTATLLPTDTLIVPTFTLPPEFTATPLPPSLTPTPRYPSGIQAGCIDGRVWLPYKTQNISQDSSGCWDLSHWGVAAEGDQLRFSTSNPTASDNYRGIYSPINPLLADGAAQAVLSLTIQIDQLMMDPSQRLGLAIGVGKADSWQYYGWFVAIRQAPNDPGSLHLFTTNDLTQTGRFIQSLPLGDAIELAVTLQDTTVSFQIDGVPFGASFTIPPAMLPEPVFWLGFGLPPNGALEATLTAIEFATP